MKKVETRSLLILILFRLYLYFSFFFYLLSDKMTIAEAVRSFDEYEYLMGIGKYPMMLQFQLKVLTKKLFNNPSVLFIRFWCSDLGIFYCSQERLLQHLHNQKTVNVVSRHITILFIQTVRGVLIILLMILIQKQKIWTYSIIYYSHSDVHTLYKR
jgi:hypothetical protein